MRRGEIWTSAGGPDYAGKPRPVVIIQNDEFDATASLTVCLITSAPEELDFFRIDLEAAESTGLFVPSRVMVDKISTIPRAKLGRKVGQLSSEEMARLDTAILIFLGLARR